MTARTSLHRSAYTGVTRAEVAKLLDMGLTVRQVAAALEITTQMVYQHRKRIRAERTRGDEAPI